MAFGKIQIENIHDYVYSLQANKPGEKTSITIVRKGEGVMLAPAIQKTLPSATLTASTPDDRYNISFSDFTF